MTNEGPFKSAFESDTDGVILKELVTYRVRDGMLCKETTTRRYSGDGDYYDNSSTQPLHTVIDNG